MGKMRRLLRTHPDMCNLILNHKNQTPLHVAAKLGNEDIVFLLIKEGADATAVDKSGNIPLHYAAMYCLKHFSSSLLHDLVGPLMTPSQTVMSVANRKGRTCADLVTSLKEKESLRNQIEDSSEDLESDELLNKNEKDEWHEKLQFGESDDLWDSLGTQGFGSSSGSAEDYFMGETFDEWANRIFTEYHRRKQSKDSEKITTNPSKTSNPTTSMMSNRLGTLKPPILKTPSYEQFCRRLQDPSTELTVSSFPFTLTTPPEVIVDTILQGSCSKSEDLIKLKIKSELRRWHPDKFNLQFGQIIAREEKDKIFQLVTYVAQALISYTKS